MELKKRNLKIYSLLFLVLAIVGVVQLVLAYLQGDFNVSAIAQQTGASEQLALIVVIATLAFIAIVILLEAYVAVKGVKQANGTGKGASHITISKIMMVFIIISLAGNIYYIIKGQIDWLGLLRAIIGVLLVFGYIHEATALFAEQE